VRTFNWKAPQHIPDFPVGYQEVHTDKYSATPRYVYEPIRPVGVVEKCTFCVQRIDNDQVPFCIGVCPARARIFGSQSDPNSEVSKLIRGGTTVRIMTELGTGPEVYFIPPRKKGLNDQKQWITTLDATANANAHAPHQGDSPTAVEGEL
jgi:molybdopterin-containing oxidoreductase family iron-sulfur binding subunit